MTLGRLFTAPKAAGIAQMKKSARRRKRFDCIDSIDKRTNYHLATYCALEFQPMHLFSRIPT